VKLLARAFEIDFDPSKHEMREFIIPDRHLTCVVTATRHTKAVFILASKERAWCSDNLTNFSLYATQNGYLIQAPETDIILAQLRFL
jgi:hypothetical protein